MRDPRGKSKAVAGGRGPWSGVDVRRLVTAFRRIVGMPDYEAYVAHLERCHPGSVVPSPREFFDQYVSARYSGGPTRCC